MSRWRSFFKSKLPKGKFRNVDVARVIQQALTTAGLLKSPKENDASADSTNAHETRTREQKPASFFWDIAGTGADLLDYKVFLPTSLASSSRRVSLIVMLHGCTQDPDDFALGTRMNALAERNGFIVAYPQQPVSANSSKCWNWFRPEDQFRDAGEPAKIAKMIHDSIARYPIDTSRIFVAGMSAGAAMAIVMIQTYPELFAAAASHSGLPYRSASNVVSALSAMKNARGGEQIADSASRSIPLIVFHGDQDHTVDSHNSDLIVEQAIGSRAKINPLHLIRTDVVAEGGRSCDRLLYGATSGKVAIEQWVIKGAGHRWSGGDEKGSHTDSSGPDAAAHIVRFFADA